MRILLIEDSPRLRSSIQTGLKKSGYAIDVAEDGEEGLWKAMEGEYDTIILDWMLPKMDGMTVLKTLRKKGKNAHVLILTARDQVEDRVRGLREGGDDYLVKPFAFDELLARIEALCRRSYGRKESRIQVADLVIDTHAKTVQRAARVLDLTSREFMILEYLANRAGEVVSRSEIESHVYGESAELMSNSIDSAICMIRRKMDAKGLDPLLHTRRGMGYVLEKKSQ